MAIAAAVGSMRTPSPRRRRTAAGDGWRPSKTGGGSPIAARSMCSGWRASTGLAFGVRRPARGNRAARQQTGPRVRPHPSRRHRARGDGRDAAGSRASAHACSIWWTTNRRRVRDVVAEAARLLGVTAPDAVPFERALAAMTPMARSFWAENRKVSSRRTQQDTRPALAVSELSRGTTRHPGRGARRASGVAAPDPAAATGDDRRPSPGSPERPGW